MPDNTNPKVPHPNDPVTPRDYNPEHNKEFPHDKDEIVGEKENPSVVEKTYDNDLTDDQGRSPSERRTGKFIVPNGEESAGEGWTLPTRPGGGWNHPLEQTLEEQIDEPELPGDVNHK